VRILALFYRTHAGTEFCCSIVLCCVSVKINTIIYYINT